MRRAVVRRRCTAGASPTCAYVITTPWKSEDVPPTVLENVGSSWMPTRAAACAHCDFRWSVGATTVSWSTVPSASISVATRNANVVLPAPGVATARKSSGRRRR